MIGTTRTYKAAAFLLALVFGVFLVQGGDVSAELRGTSQKSAEELAGNSFSDCRALGGTATIHYDMNTDGSIDSITVTCDGRGASVKSNCTYYQGSVTTEIFCALMPGETEPSEHTTIGDGVLEEVEPTTAPVHGDLGGGTLDTSNGSSSRPRVTGGTRSSVIQVDDDERP